MTKNLIFISRENEIAWIWKNMLQASAEPIAWLNFSIMNFHILQIVSCGTCAEEQT